MNPAALLSPARGRHARRRHLPRPGPAGTAGVLALALTVSSPPGRPVAAVPDPPPTGPASVHLRLPPRGIHHVAHAARKPRHHRHHRHHHHPAPRNLYDSANPAAIPSGRHVAVYATGRYAVQPHETRRFGRVLWIDAIGTDPGADVLDVEPGDARPGQVPAWVRAHAHRRHGLVRIYTFRNWWPAVRAAVRRLPWRYRHLVRYWIADPTGREHMVPGADATQWKWAGDRFDRSKTRPRFWR